MSISGILWTASPIKHYGYGAGRAHPSVEHVACPVCRAPKGALCIGSDGGPHLNRHYKRAYAYQDLKRKIDAHAKDWANRFMVAHIDHIDRGQPRLTRGSRFAICGFRGCQNVGRKCFTTGRGKYPERHWYCCWRCGMEFVKGGKAVVQRIKLEMLQRRAKRYPSRLPPLPRLAR